MGRKKGSAVAALVAAILVGSVLVVSPASALSCNNCVDSSDVVNESLGSADIGGNAIRSGEIADGQVYSADIANGSVGLADLHPAARPAAGHVALTATTPITSGTGTFDTFTVTPPGPGVLVVRVTGAAYLDLNALGGAAEVASGTLALCTAGATTSAAACGPATFELWSQDADNADAFNETDSFSLERTFQVPSASPVTFYLNGAAGAASLYLYGGPSVNGAVATVQFAPALLSITS